MTSLTTPDNACAWLVSLIFVASLLSLGFYNLYAVYKSNNIAKVAEPRPYIDVVYLGLKETKGAKYFWSVFIIRRCFLAFIVVVLKDYQGI